MEVYVILMLRFWKEYGYFFLGVRENEEKLYNNYIYVLNMGLYF